MYYIKDNAVYIKNGDSFQNVKITAKEKIITVHELESITVTPGAITKTLDNAFPATLDEVKGKFHLDGEHPIEFDESLVDKSQKQSKSKE
ncbi:MAG: hypothetical protein KA953_00485 [Lachnospiraceae bacterium]|nr:hypothetical protein [Lachnospiraceae bacterium]